MGDNWGVIWKSSHKSGRTALVITDRFLSSPSHLLPCSSSNCVLRVYTNTPNLCPSGEE